LTASTGWPGRAAQFLLTPRGDRRWDLFLRSLGAAALLGIPIVILFPSTVPLVWLAVLSIPANSPLSPLFPASFEPLIMEAAKHARPIVVTAVALVAYLYMEFINWHVYGWVLRWKRLAGMKEHRAVQRSLYWFGRKPMIAIAVFAATPLPFWAVRLVALMADYPLGRFMLATAIGRLPRLYFYAWLGDLLVVPAWVLATIIFGTGAVVIIWRKASGKRLLSEPVLDASEEAA
jgi:uncharacterized membrane protein YdjX (TVP38/TMEM64 family)